jgi:hypothetical protein
LLKFLCVAIFSQSLTFFQKCFGGGVVERGPEISGEKDGCCAFECGRERRGLFQVGLYDFNSLFFRGLGFGRIDVASDAPDFPTGKGLTWLPVMPVTTRSLDIIFANAILVVVG